MTFKTMIRMFDEDMYAYGIVGDEWTLLKNWDSKEIRRLRKKFTNENKLVYSSPTNQCLIVAGDQIDNLGPIAGEVIRGKVSFQKDGHCGIYAATVNYV